jgi:hypothetical protein
MPRPQRLSVRHVDEISSVDVDANGHAQIMISKRDEPEGAQMPKIFDPETEQELDPDKLEFGQVVVGEDGEEYTFMSDEDVEQLRAEGLLDDGDEDDDAGNSVSDGADEGELVSAIGKRGGVSSLFAKRAAPKQSLGQAVQGMLSKALNEAERDEIVSKALDVMQTQLEAARRETREAVTIAKRLANDAELDEYAAIADDLGVPADPREMAGIFQAMSGVLSKRQLDTVERVFTAAGNAAQYEAIGANGGSTPSAVGDQLNGAIDSIIAKGDVAITREQAMVALLETNPEYYDAYMAEQGDQ